MRHEVISAASAAAADKPAKFSAVRWKTTRACCTLHAPQAHAWHAADVLGESNATKTGSPAAAQPGLRRARTA